jgi:hypothetical protein
MGNQIKHEQIKPDLILPWIVVGIMLAALAAYIIICHTMGGWLQRPLPEAQRVLIRTVFYAIAIVTFPLTNLIRHIQLQLNRTMPRSETTHRNDVCTSTEGKLAYQIIGEAKSRYLVTIIVSMSLVEVIGVLGLTMFVLGDGFNTLYIFTRLSALGLFLYRPKADEYFEIIGAIEAQENE